MEFCSTAAVFEHILVNAYNLCIILPSDFLLVCIVVISAVHSSLARVLLSLCSVSLNECICHSPCSCECQAPPKWVGVAGLQEQSTAMEIRSSAVIGMRVRLHPTAGGTFLSCSPLVSPPHPQARCHQLGLPSPGSTSAWNADLVTICGQPSSTWSVD